MAVIFVLTCFVSALSVMLVTGQNFSSTSEQPFDVTTTVARNATEVESTSDASHKVNCSAEYKGYCLNGGRCYYLIEEDVHACDCPSPYGGQRCKKYDWYTSKSECEDERAIDSLMLALFIIITIVLIVIIIIMTVQLRRFYLKIKKLERKNGQSPFHDYGAHFLPTMYSTQISAISHEKHNMKSRSAPMEIGRLSQNFFNPSPTELNGIPEITKTGDTKQSDQHKNGKTSYGSNSSA